MRLLPILWAEPPTAEDWARLSRAREACGYTDPIQPANALPGSPQPVLCIGQLPSWATDYEYVESTADPVLLADALKWCLGERADYGDKLAELIGEWMSSPEKVTYTGEEEHVEPVGFGT